MTGIDGNYRLTCERVLRLLRHNNDSILAVLEAFVYDPVLNWRPDGNAAAGKKELGLGTDPVALTAHYQQHAGELNRGENEAINRVKAKLSGENLIN